MVFYSHLIMEQVRGHNFVINLETFGMAFDLQNDLRSW